MIKKIIACADIHIRGLRRLDETYELLEKFIEKVKEEMEGYSPEEIRIVVAGDIFENKITVTNEGNVTVAWFFRELNSIAKTIVIGGNHDYLATNRDRMDSITPIFQIGDFDNVIYLDSNLEFESGYLEDDNVVWCLYSIFDNYMRPGVEAAKKMYPEHKYIGLVHGEVMGSKTDKGYVSDKGLNTSLFKGLDFVIAGHIHKYQVLKYGKTPIVYCSSLIQQNNGENLSGHGYVVWDIESNSHEFKEIENPNFGYYVYSINGIEDINENNEILINA